MKTEEILTKIYRTLDIAEALPELKPKMTSSSYVVVCPKCGRREVYLRKGCGQIECNRLEECKYSISIWEYIQTRDNLSNRETLKKLAQLSAYSLPESEPEDLDTFRPMGPAQ
jgi:hypothetical protein